MALVVKNLPASAGDIRDAGSVRGLGRSPGEGHSNHSSYFCLENPMDRRTWQSTGSQSWTGLKWLSMHTCMQVQTESQFCFTLSYSPSLVAQMVKNLPEMRESRVQSLDLEENPVDRGAWWSTVHGVSKSEWLTLPLSHSLIPVLVEHPPCPINLGWSAVLALFLFCSRK